MNPSLRRALGSAYRAVQRHGIDPLKTVQALKGHRWIAEDRRAYEAQRRASAEPEAFPQGPAYPVASDRDDQAGTARGHYFHQDLLVAQEIFRRNPRRHVDVGSAMYGFVSHVASFRAIDVIDIRPLEAKIPNIHFVKRDAMTVSKDEAPITDSLSCLHALEHFGLGRYGDPVDYDGWRKGLTGLTALLEPGGILYLGVPTGEPQRVEFNAHRVFSLPYLRRVLEADYDIVRLAFVHDAGDLTPDANPHSAEADRSFDARYGCSIWVLRKHG